MFVMITEAQLVEMVKEAKAATKQKKFKQSIELIMNFKDIDVKKGFAINEVVQLPKTSSPGSSTMWRVSANGPRRASSPSGPSTPG